MAKNIQNFICCGIFLLVPFCKMNGSRKNFIDLIFDFEVNGFMKKLFHTKISKLY